MMGSIEIKLPSHLKWMDQRRMFKFTSLRVSTLKSKVIYLVFRNLAKIDKYNSASFF
jgi:hypothetical protein